MAADLKTIYKAASDAEAEQRLAELILKWDAKFPMIAKIMAQRLGPGDSVLHAPARDSESDLHDQGHRVIEHVAVQGDQGARLVSQ